MDRTAAATADNWVSISDAATLATLRAKHARDQRFARHVERLHRLGSRVLYEMLAEIGAELMARDLIEDRVADYSSINPAILHELHGDRFAPSPMRIIGGAE